MKTKKSRILLLISVIAALLALVFTLPACTIKAEGSIQSITRPYIAQYECTKARLGEKNLLDDYDYVRFVLLDKNQLELEYKPKNGEKQTRTGTYQLDPQTRELTAEIGLLGYRFKESVILEKGRFTVTKPIGTKELVLVFEMK